MSTGLTDVDLCQRSYLKTQEILDLMLVFQEALRASQKGVLVDGGKQLHLLQKEIQEIDLAIEKRLGNGSSLSTAENHALAERTKLREEILKLNKVLLPKITNIKSTLAGEMSSLKKSRTALKGYGDNSINGGKLINKSW